MSDAPKTSPTAQVVFALRHCRRAITLLAMVWALLVGWIWFAEVPTAQMLLGSLIVIAAGSLIVWRERQLGKDETARRKVRAKGLQ